MAVLPNNNHVKSLECFKPYKRADGRVITSQVSKDTKEWYDVQLCMSWKFLAVKIIRLLTFDSRFKYAHEC